MVKHIFRSCFYIITFFFAVNSTAYGKDISCVSLERCEAEVTAALTSGTSPANRVSYYDISRAFSNFGQDGFDTLFKTMENSSGERQGLFIKALSHMKDDSQNLITPAISPEQYNTIVKMWSSESEYYYSLGRLINYTDTPESHDFMIATLQAADEDRRYWSERIINIEGFGNGESSIEGKHLSTILDIIKTQKNSELGLVPALQRVDHPDAESALWSLLESNDRWVFARAFEFLLKKDAEKVYQVLQAQSFVDTPEDQQRALIIAAKIWQKYYKKKLVEQTYHYWKDWYDATDTSETERIIPSYLLFHLFEATKVQVDSADKYIEKRERWRDYTQTNPEGRTGHLSVKYLNYEIEAKRAENSRLIPFLQLQTARLTQNETHSMRDYFRIFGAQKELVREKVYTNGGEDFLPLQAVLDAAIQSPEMWTAQFWRYVDDSTFAENSAIIEKITELETDEGKLKSFYLKRLKQTDNVPKLLSTLIMIAKTEKLRTDRDIKSAAQAVAQDTPFTGIKIATDYASADTPPPKGIRVGFHYGWLKPFDEIMMSANAKERYCTAASHGTPPYMTVQPDLNMPRLVTFNQLGKAVMTVQTPSGYLAGHNRGEFGGGLLYHSNVAAEGQLLPLKYARNVIAINETETEGIYWVLAGLDHMVPGMGAIYKVDARTDQVSVTPHKRMLAVPKRTSVLKDGSLFMDFTRKSYTSIDKDGQRKSHKIDDERYNPPVTLTRRGELISACKG